MSDTQFIDHQTPIVTPWLQDVNDTVYKALGAPKTVAQAIANLGAAKQSDLNTTNQNIANFSANNDRTKGSNLVGYFPSGTGATGRTVQDRLDDFVSVKNFGVKGDGTTDDTTAIQNALNTVTNGILFFPNTGNAYKISNSITLKSNIALFFEAGATITQTVTAKPTFTGTSLSKFYLGGAGVLAGYSSTYSATGHGVIELSSCSDFYIGQLEIKNIEQYGILHTDCTDYTIERCSIHDFGYCAIMGLAGASSGCVNGHVVRNKIANCTMPNDSSCYGIAFGCSSASYNMSHSHIWIEENYVTGVQRWNGLDIHGGQYIYFRRNVVTNCRRGVEATIGYTNSSTPHLDNIWIENNVFTAATANVGTQPESGILCGGALNGATVYTATNYHITGNKCDNFNHYYTGASLGGIYITNIDGFDVRGNDVSNNYYNGIVLVAQSSSCKNGVIANNQLPGNTQYAINLTSTAANSYQDIDIDGNYKMNGTLNGAVCGVAGVNVRLRNNDFTGLTGSAISGTIANFNVIKNNIGFVSRASGQTGSIASAALVTTGLSAALYSVNVVPITATPATAGSISVATNGNNFNIYFTGAGPVPFMWEAAIQQDV